MPGSGSEVQRAAARRRSDAVARRATRALDGVAGDGATVVVVGVRQVGADAWAVLAEAGLSVVAVDDVPEALRAVARHSAQVVIADVPRGSALVRALRCDPRLAAVHVVLAAPLESATQLRAALDAGADDVMRIPFEPEVLAARVGGGLRAARLRAGEVLLRSLVANVPGVVYRCARTRIGRWSGSAARSRRSPVTQRRTSSRAGCGASPVSSIPTTAGWSSARCARGSTRDGRT